MLKIKVNSKEKADKIIWGLVKTHIVQFRTYYDSFQDKEAYLIWYKQKAD